MVQVGPVSDTLDHIWTLSLGQSKKEKRNRDEMRFTAVFSSRGDWIRTSDLYVPNVALYQAEPRPDWR